MLLMFSLHSHIPLSGQVWFECKVTPTVTITAEEQDQESVAMLVAPYLLIAHSDLNADVSALMSSQ